MMNKIYPLLLSFFCFCGLPIALHAQVNQIEFGKNRVQYHDDFEEWLQYESRNFVTYFYGKGRRVAESAILLAESNHNRIQRLLEHRINDKIELIVYTDLTDLKQSNIGTEEAFTNTGGHTKIVGSKVFVYFNGNHNDLEVDIREGIAQVYLQSMLFGSNFQEIVQNAILMHLPEWFEKGLISFAGQEWSTEIDNRMRDIFIHGMYKNFQDFADQEPELAGHAMWYYIFQNYGKSTVSNLLYLTRINRSEESGFLYVLGNRLESIATACMQYYDERYKDELQLRDSLPKGPLGVKNKKNLPITAFSLSPSGQQLAYVTNEIGRIKVFVHNVVTGDRKTLFKTGFRNAFQSTDYNYPLLAWKPVGQELGILYEKKDNIYLLEINLKTGERKRSLIPNQYYRIYSFQYLDNFNAVLSASVDGYSDLFLYKTNTRQSTRLTQDYYDDLDATFVQLGGQPGLLFASNRPGADLTPARLDTTLPTGNFDLYYLGLQVDDQGQREIVQITRTPAANERYPMPVDSTWYSFLSNQAGVSNRTYGFLEKYVDHYERHIYLTEGAKIVLHEDSTLQSLDSLAIDSIVQVPIYKRRGVNFNASNYPLGILEQRAAPRMGRYVEKISIQGREQLFLSLMKPGGPPVDAPFSKFQYYEHQRMQPPPPRPTPSLDTIGFEALPPIETRPPSTVIPKKDTLPPPQKELKPEQLDTGKVDIENYFFQSEFEDEEDYSFVNEFEDQKKETEEETTKRQEEELIRLKRLEEAALRPSNPLQQPRVDRFLPSRITPYRLKFRMDYFTTQADNRQLFDGLDNFAGIRQEFDYLPAGILLKANFKDLLEDYELEGGTRIPFSFNGTEFFVVYNDKKKRIDKRFALYRRSLRDIGDPQSDLPSFRDNVLLGMAQLRYPFDIFRSLRATLTVRHDETIQLATDQRTLDEPTARQQRAGLRLEYVFDNTLQRDINLLNGTRYKIYTEAVKRFNISFNDNNPTRIGDGFMGVVGLDARHYQPFLKHSVLAGRVAGASSFGAENILFYLGGTDGWLFPSFSNEVALPPNGDFAFQGLATSMRGFPQNIRNGGSYLLANAELRVPIFKYFSKRIKSNFFRHFQLVGFFDAGTAWQGPSPFDSDNPLNTEIVSNAKVRVKVNYFRDPVVFGYGAGVRTMLFGYFVRLDYAWGIDSRQVLDPRIHVSLGTDF